MSIRCVAWLQNRSSAASLGMVLGWLLLASGCADDNHRLGGAASGIGTPRVGLCSKGADLELIDHMEDGDGTIEMTAQRSGVWFSFHDKTPGTQEPPSDAETFPMAELVPARSGSHYAAHSQGSGFNGDWGAGIGFEIYSQKAYDLSSYAGITFWARRAPNAESTVRFAVTDAATAPRGKQCKDYPTEKYCSDYFGIDVALSTSFQRHSFSWAELKQIGWGRPDPDSVDASQVYGIRFQSAPGADFDYWIDDIALLCRAE